MESKFSHSERLALGGYALEYFSKLTHLEIEEKSKRSDAIGEIAKKVLGKPILNYKKELLSHEEQKSCFSYWLSHKELNVLKKMLENESISR